MSSRFMILLVALVAASVSLPLRAQSPILPLKAELIEVRKLADDAPHSAFTDLIYFTGTTSSSVPFARGAATSRPTGGSPS